MKTWRDKMRPMIAEVIERIGLDDPKQLKRELDGLYERHCGPKETYLRRIWLSEVKAQEEWFRKRR